MYWMNRQMQTYLFIFANRGILLVSPVPSEDVIYLMTKIRYTSEKTLALMTRQNMKANMIIVSKKIRVPFARLTLYLKSTAFVKMFFSWLILKSRNTVIDS